MDFKAKVIEIFGNIKEKILSLTDTLIDFYHENKTKAIIIAGSVFTILIALLLILSLSSAKKNKKGKIIKEQVLELTEKLETPDGPVLPRDYNISRKSKEKWSDEDALEWFTLPEEKEIEALSKSNEAIVNEIIGAAP